MAIFHFSAKVIGRSSGRSSVAAAAYRAGEKLQDERLDRAHDFTDKTGVIHSEVMLPEGAPEEFADREKLWNAVEKAEKRKDAQLAREVEFALPRELSKEDAIELAREFVEAEFVTEGMIADLNVHWDIGEDGQPKPHAHVMLTMREVGPDGFGAKVRDWNRSELIEQWRERWAEHVNLALAERDIDARVDHRSLAEQGIALEPQDKIGPAASRIGTRGLEAERIEEHRAIAQGNGTRIIANPALALDAITHSQATFTARDLAAFIHRHSDGKEQFDAALGAVRHAPELVALGKDGRGTERYTSRAMIETEQRLHLAGDSMAARDRHAVAGKHIDHAICRGEERNLLLSGEQRAAFEHVTGAKGLAIVIGFAGTGKSAMLGVAREAWESAGYTVHGAALSGIAAENLESGSGIASRTLASLDYQWSQGRELLGRRDVLVIDEAGMVGTRQLERVLSRAADAGAKVVLVGDPQQLQAIEAGAAFRALHECHGGVEITEIRRQHADWQRDATRHLATGRTGEAIGTYADRGMVHAETTREIAREQLIARWDGDRRANPEASRIILTHTNDEVRALNQMGRERMRATGELGPDVEIRAERGERLFASGDRLMFLRNERGLGIKNGTLGTIDTVKSGRMTVRTDDGRKVAFDTKDYTHFDHGYAATIHKAQGVTVDRTHVLATPGMDSHGTYVALSRHREQIDLHYSKDDFADQLKLVRLLGRDRAKDMAGDYAERDPARDFAERRRITFREKVAEMVRQIPAKVRGIFDGFRPGKSKLEAIPVSGPAANPQYRAIERYAKAHIEVVQMQAQGLPVLPHQNEALDRAGKALDALRPSGATDLATAIERAPQLAVEAAAGRSQAAHQAMKMEAELRADPGKRADRFVSDWRQLSETREALQRGGDVAGARGVANRMAELAKGLERDPQLTARLQNRTRELGLDHKLERSLERELTATIGLGRSRSMDFGI